MQRYTMRLLWQLLFILIVSRLHGEIHEKIIDLPKYLRVESLPNLVEISRRSYFEVNEQFVVPDDNIWAVCSYCQYQNGSFVLPSERNSSVMENKTILLSRSLWREFFFAFNNDLIYGELRNDSFLAISEKTVHITSMIFYLPMITFHPGHILIDVLEPIYSSLQRFSSNDPTLRRDEVILVIDVAGAPERSVLNNYIRTLTSSKEYLASIISSITKTIISASDFFTSIADHHLLFQFIHFGSAIDYSSYYTGFRFHPNSFEAITSTKYFQVLQQKYEDFCHYQQQYVQQEYLLSDQTTSLSSPSVASTAIMNKVGLEIDVLIIQRSNNRIILNLEQLLHEIDSLGLTWEILDPSQVDFRSQLVIFQRVSKVVVAVAGTAIHNIIWINTPAWVIIMPPLWCEWSWLYANSIYLRNRRVEVICADREKRRTRDSVEVSGIYSWTRKAWNQMPRLTRTLNFIVDFLDFAKALRRMALNVTLVEGQNDSSREKGVTDRSIPSKMRSFFSDVSVEGIEVLLEGSQESIRKYKLRIEGNSYGSSGSLAAFFRSSSSAALCVSELGDEVHHWCYPFSDFNYYATLDMTIEAEFPTVMHFWVQAFTTGGKLRESDVLLPLDCQVFPQDCGASIAIKGRFWINSQKDWQCLSSKKTKSVAVTCRREMVDRLLHELRLQAGISNNPSHHFRLPFRQIVPTLINPFIFLHFDKSAGTTIREMVHASILRDDVSRVTGERLQGIIPCYGNISCFIFHLRHHYSYVPPQQVLTPPPLTLMNVSVVAGHFSWDVWRDLPSCPPQICQPSCLVIGRSPIDRIISYYYQRIALETSSPFYQKSLNEIDLQTWQQLLIEHRFARYLEDDSTAPGNVSIVIVDEGMSDAVCRTLLNTRTTTGLVNPTVALSLPPLFTAADIQEAKRRLRHCVVGLTERWSETIEILEYWFPWMGKIEKTARFNVNSDPQGVSQSQSKERKRMKETSKTLRSDLAAAILEVNPCDQAIYDEMQLIFTEELMLLSRIQKKEK